MPQPLAGPLQPLLQCFQVPSRYTLTDVILLSPFCLDRSLGQPSHAWVMGGSLQAQIQWGKSSGSRAGLGVSQLA